MTRSQIKRVALSKDVLVNSTPEEVFEYLRDSSDAAPLRVQIPDDASPEEIADLALRQSAFNATARNKRNA